MIELIYDLYALESVRGEEHSARVKRVNQFEKIEYIFSKVISLIP